MRDGMIEKDEAADEFGRTGNLNGMSSPNQVKVEHLPLVKQKYDSNIKGLALREKQQSERPVELNN